MVDSVDKELQDMKVKRGRKKGEKAKEPVDNQKNITYINDYIRFTTMSDDTMMLEVKNDYTDGSYSWGFKGYYGSSGHLMLGAMKQIKNKRLMKQKISDMEYYVECARKAEEEVFDFFKV